MIIADQHFPFLHYLSDEDLFNRAWLEATDEEKHLAKLTAVELARKYQEAKVANDEAKCILVEHYLSLRIVNIQTGATKRASYVAVLGTILGVVLGFALRALPSCY